MKLFLGFEALDFLVENHDHLGAHKLCNLGVIFGFGAEEPHHGLLFHFDGRVDFEGVVVHLSDFFAQRAQIADGGVRDFTGEGFKTLDGLSGLVSHHFLGIGVSHDLQVRLDLLRERPFCVHLGFVFGNGQIAALTHSNRAKVPRV